LAIWLSRITSAPRTSLKRASSEAQHDPTSWANRPGGIDHGLGQVAALVLDHRQLPDPIGQGGIAGNPLVEPFPESDAELATTGHEDLVEEIGATDCRDGVEEAQGQAVVVGRKEVLGVGRHVVAMARSADPVALHLVGDEAGLLEGMELLEDAGPAGPEMGGQAVG
jgi:hypothetical protein